MADERWESIKRILTGAFQKQEPLSPESQLDFYNWEIVKKTAQGMFQGKERELFERLIDSFQENELSWARIYDGLERIGDLKFLADQGYELDALKELTQRDAHPHEPER